MFSYMRTQTTHLWAHDCFFGMDIALPFRTGPEAYWLFSFSSQRFRAIQRALGLLMGCGSTQSLYCLAFEGLLGGFAVGEFSGGRIHHVVVFLEQLEQHFAHDQWRATLEGAGKSGVGGPGLGSLIPAFARVLITIAGGSVFGQENGRYPNFEILSSPNFLKS